eukprot:1205755-Amphidinium_carterae.1
MAAQCNVMKGGGKGSSKGSYFVGKGLYFADNTSSPRTVGKGLYFADSTSSPLTFEHAFEEDEHA